MPDDEKPKRTRSWREIDKQRDRGGSSTALPDHVREKLGGGEEDVERDEARKKLYAIEDPKAFHAAATEFLRKYPLPDDPRVLDRLLGHPDDEVVDRALTRLEELHRAGTLKVPPALSQRLASVEIESGLPALRRRAADLRKAIR